MANLPLVSIITASYNQGEFIEDAILSVKNQLYQEIEHIIIDGASTDNTLAVIKKYEGTYNMRCISEPDDGPIEATNKGLRQAQGEILGQLPTDDLYLPWAVSVIVEYFKQHPDVELVYGDAINMNLETGTNRLALYPRYSLPFLKRRGILPSIATFFRKSILEKVGLLDENLGVGGDYEYWIRAAEQCEVSRIDEVLAVDRLHPKSRRVRLRQAIRKESKEVRQTYGAPRGIKKYPCRIMDLLQPFVARRFLRIKFAFYYWTKRGETSSGDSLPYPWQNLMEFPGFQVISWIGFLVMMLPWAVNRYRKNWFILSTGGVDKK